VKTATTATSYRLVMLAGLLTFTLNAPAALTSKLDTDTGGGMGGTGNSVDNPDKALLVPLNSKSQVACRSGAVIGSYQLSHSAARQPIHNRPLCLNTVFVLNEGEEVVLSLPSGQTVTVKATGTSRLQITRTTHHAWGARLEIEINPVEGQADAKINSGVFPIPLGFVGQIWIEGGQAFWGLRKNKSIN
jgi:hypothetical protein